MFLKTLCPTLEFLLPRAEEEEHEDGGADDCRADCDRLQQADHE
jgi:hypothetical protein